MPVTEALFRPKNWITDWGAHPSRSAADNDTAIQRCLAFLLLRGEVEIVVPSGTFAISQTIDLPAGFRLIGHGKSSILDMDDAMAVAAVDLHTDTYVGHLQIIGKTSGGVTAGSRGIQASGGTVSADWVAHWTIDNVHISFVEDGIYLNNTWSSDIYSAYVTACTNGLHIAGTGADQANSIDMYGGEFHGSTNGVLVDAIVVTGLNFFGGTNEGHTGYGIKLGDSTSGIRGVLVSGVYFEANGLGDIYATLGGAGVESLAIENTRHFNFTDAIKLDKVDKGHITGARFQRASFTTQKPITLGSSCRYVTVGDCRYRPTGQLVFSQAADDTGEQNTVDNTPRPWNISGDDTTDVTDELKAWALANPDTPHLPEGVYIVSDTIPFTQDQIVTGDGMTKSIIKAAPGFAGPVVTFGFRTHMRDFGVQGVAGTTCMANDGAGVDWIMERLNIRSGDIGLELNHAANNGTIRDCLVQLNTAQGIKITSASGTLERLNVISTKLLSNGAGIEVTGASRLINLIGCTFEGNTVSGYSTSAAVNGGVIHGCRFTNNGTVDLGLLASSRGYHVAGNRFDTTPSSLIIACLESTFENNVFNPGGMTPAAVTLNTVIDCEFGINRATTGDAPGPALVTDTRNTYLGKYYGSVAPAAGTWLKGNFVWNIDPDPADAIGWGCSAAGTPGTWINGPVYQ